MEVVGGRLAIQWTIFEEVRAVTVHVGKDVEFTSDARQYVLPATATASQIFVGRGAWYIRVGAWSGTPNQSGKVEWSGVYGPFQVEYPKEGPSEPAGVLKLLHIESIKGGIRIHTGRYDPHYAVFDYVVGTDFKASLQKTVWTYDWGRGFVECDGLRPEYTYSIRLMTFSDQLGDLPTGEIKPLTAPILLKNKKCLPDQKPHNFGDYIVNQAADILLKEAKASPNKRYASYTDYIKVIEAEARAKGEKRSV